MADIFPSERFEGSLSNGAASVPIAFVVSAGEDCRLVFDVEPGGRDLGRMGFGVGATPGLEMPEYALRGRSAAGNTITSDSVSIIAHGHSGQGHTIGIEAGEATLVVPLNEPQDQPILREWFRSFKSFRNPVFETPLGRVVVHGDAKVPNKDVTSGYVAVQAPAGAVPDDWRQRADAFLLHMQRGIAFAHGGRLQVPRLDYIAKDESCTTFYAGEPFRSEFPVQHQLNHGPILQTLVDRYFDHGPLPEVLWTALGWMQSDTTFDELRYLTAMTALETIIETELPAKKGTTVPKSDFKAMRAELDKVVAASALSDVERNIFRQRLAGMNRKSFAEKIDGLFDHYGLSRDDFGGNAIGSLVKLRNDIVHRGHIPDDVDAWPMIILVRELITRILLTAIGFEGKYRCYVGGLHDRVIGNAAPSAPSPIVIAPPAAPTA
ncbi:hypothetical protein [Sphingomonas sp. BK481]|uniref:hypothetical protein n=1 Tax=Sphingomonas sp. BK481 TaxID=2586981 RepID=UPI001622054A|nr:hypothetical protein [Sphingomonas sp. BK481]MBB3587133.1 hypothetical protein [Sphingomonas sp. BK481]